MTPGDRLWLAVGFVIALLVSSGAITVLEPLWRHYAMARPNARSSHKEPTPQGGGSAVLLGLFCFVALSPLVGLPTIPFPTLLAALLLGVVGAIDDIRVLPPAPRLAVQVFAVIVVVASLPADFHALDPLPWWLERGLLAVGLLWFVNLTNFMDGIDWMTVGEVVPLTAALAVCAAFGFIPSEVGFGAAALCGALVGFAPFNRPVARLFLGDVGSLPIGLITGWLLIRLAEHHLAAALLLPLYYLADATITLARRFLRGERVSEAHRCHFYQQAVDDGVPVREVIAQVVLLNLALIALAGLTLLVPTAWVHAAALTVGFLMTYFVLARLGKAKR
jgi:UDP-N-acetylmuramyl pentapeptide phosphotransferase/UDP-N-acetylglucosamine-1-phosphate transferase